MGYEVWEQIANCFSCLGSVSLMADGNAHSHTGPDACKQCEQEFGAVDKDAWLYLVGREE